MCEAVLALGTNLGDRMDNIQKALCAISKLPKTEILQVSSYYETEPFDVPVPEDDFINCCVKISTELEAHTLLGACLGMEAVIGRVRTYRNAARVIDIDVLLYDSLVCSTEDLILPHPRITERAFVMVPLCDLYPDKNALGLYFADALSKTDCSGVRKVQQ